MSGRGSTALRELESHLRCIEEQDTPLTVRQLIEVVKQAAEGTEDWEYSDYMGEEM